jgi:inhibitor of cysteine peptidase
MGGIAMALLRLTDIDNGKSLEARQGDEIILRLPENATTGYRWHIDRANAVIEQEQTSYHLDPNIQTDPNTQFGRGGVREFRFRAKANGTARLELKLWQPWEGDSSVIERFAVDIKITD